MLGSIDCMHWEWEKCPISLHGEYRGGMILESVASYDLCNDINVLRYARLL
jgi:hypothetical protein